MKRLPPAWRRHAPVALPALLLVAGCTPSPPQVEPSASLPRSDAPLAVSATIPPEEPSAPTASASAPPAAPTTAAAPAATANEEITVPRELQPRYARGTCKDRQHLTTRKGEVDCYPYRCRAGQCLLACQNRKDCAGSEGPAEMAEYGWPLDCASGSCYPLSPQHVHPRR